MKRLITLLLMMCVAVVSAMAQVEGAAEASSSFIDILKENWGTVLTGLLTFLSVIVRLTPTKKDDDILNWIIKILNAIVPNRKAGGGVHKF